MSAEIVNLRRARKAKARRAQDDQAAQNRIAFGRTKAERDAARARADQEARRLEGHRRVEPAGSQAPAAPDAPESVRPGRPARAGERAPPRSQEVGEAQAPERAVLVRAPDGDEAPEKEP